MKIAAITCSYNEDKFLPIWLRYYGKELGPENLYVIDDGSDVPVQNIFPNALRVPRPDTFSAFRPFILANGMQSLLFSLGYDIVIFADVDEIIVPCRDTYDGLHDFFEQNNQQVYTTLGLEIVHHINQESAIDWSKPIFPQRQYGRFSTTYCKSQITKIPWDWTRNLHLTSISPQIYPQLFNCHLKLVDFEYACSKLCQNQQLPFVPEEMAQGLAGHWRFSVKQLFDINYKSFLDKDVEIHWDFSQEVQHCKGSPLNDGQYDICQPLKMLPQFFQKTGV